MDKTFNLTIGNWLITYKGIEWKGNSGRPLLIEKETLLDIREADEKGDMYDWLLHITEKNWLSENDIYALNTAYIFALEYFEIGFPENFSFVETFIIQQEQMKKFMKNKYKK